MSVTFKDEADVWMILHHVLETMLSFAVKIFDKEILDNEDTAKHVFALVYASFNRIGKIRMKIVEMKWLQHESKIK